MHSVRSILESTGTNVFRIAPTATVLEAAEIMNRHHVGALVVARDDGVVGMFTERDVLNRVVARQRDPASTAVSDVMTAPVAYCSPDASRAECRSVMRQRRIRHLPVIDNGLLVGLVSIGDLLIDEGAEQQETIHYLYEYMYGGKPGTAVTNA